MDRLLSMYSGLPSTGKTGFRSILFCIQMEHTGIGILCREDDTSVPVLMCVTKVLNSYILTIHAKNACL